MRRRQALKNARLLCSILLGSLALAPPSEPARRIRVITRDEVAKTWIGLSEDEIYMVRLELKPRGDGSGGFSFLGDAPCIFQISSWNYEKGFIKMNLGTARDNCAKGKKFHGQVQGNSLNLIMEEDHWKRVASLRREADLVPRWQSLKAAMESQQQAAE